MFTRGQNAALDRLDRNWDSRVEGPTLCTDNTAPGFERCVYVTYRSNGGTYCEYVITRDGTTHVVR